MKLQQMKVHEPGPDEQVSVMLPYKPISVIHRSDNFIFTWIDLYYYIVASLDSPAPKWKVVSFVTNEEFTPGWEYISSTTIPGDRVRHFFARDVNL